MASLLSSKRHKDLPNDLLHKNILPRLPFKYLNRLKCISKELHSLISTDAKFAADQSQLADTSSSGFVYMNDGVLSFFPDPSLIGVPDPSLNFLNPGNFDLVSSTNGLLLLEGEFNCKTSLCVCNPATKEMVFIPESVGWEKYSYYLMGLAFEPCELPNQFTLVQPLLCYHRDCYLYQFTVFRSNIGKWTSSSRSVNLGSYWVAANPVCAKGVIYWCCSEYLLWYDTKRDLAGSVMLPTIEERIHVGVCAGQITFCRSWVGGIEVWRLTRGSCWDRLHALSWDGKLDAFNICHGMHLLRNSQSEMFFRRHIIFPVGFDGQFVYFAVRLMDRDGLIDRDSTSRLFRWETETGQVEEKGVINLRKGMWLECHKYANSMARVPQIWNGTS
ncbi:F-box protein [Carex littledalei]|uniref:F-box protein n=1 Tax=Carex littledalei TaxID=544730 RepID=A0A833VSV7_9POAL|nr:F-box protein [Carex littledalei]